MLGKSRDCGELTGSEQLFWELMMVSTSLMAAREDSLSMVLSGLPGALAGACIMAAGEFVSVSTQRDIERETFAKLISEPSQRRSPTMIHDPKLIASVYEGLLQ
ncbi:hypothetical protein OIU85_002813 [Salix viminalis]|uniref:Vacuolar iron transporter n=1 Tax=Salix viminalis TaxID=40686 RepID=A0A9Q0VP52_SALVM|nr:hypothetical protein OIU85_002813 [Salix viminalis]